MAFFLSHLSGDDALRRPALPARTEDVQQGSLPALRDELNALRWHHQRASFYRWTVASGYAVTLIGGGLLGAWARIVIGTAPALVLMLPMFCLYMVWPRAFQRQLNTIFFGHAPRLPAEYVCSRIEEIEFELVMRE